MDYSTLVNTSLNPGHLISPLHSNLFIIIHNNPQLSLFPC